MAQTEGELQPKPVRWIGSSKADLSAFPFAKPLTGFRGAGVLEVVEDFDGNAYRAVYTVRFTGVVYVLHAFQKKSRKGIATPKSDLDLIGRRLKRAQEDYEQWQRSQRSQ